MSHLVHQLPSAALQYPGGSDKHLLEPAKPHPISLVDGRRRSRVAGRLQFAPQEIGEIEGNAGQQQRGVVLRQARRGKIRPGHAPILAQPVLKRPATAIKRHRLPGVKNAGRNIGGQVKQAGSLEQAAGFPLRPVFNADNDPKRLFPFRIPQAEAEIDGEMIPFRRRAPREAQGMPLAQLFDPSAVFVAHDEVFFVFRQAVHFLNGGELGVGADDDALGEALGLGQGPANEVEACRRRLGQAVVELGEDDAVALPG